MSRSRATLAGRVFPEDWEAGRLQHAQPGATWTVPDGAGGTRTLAAGEALFVYTPHEAVAEHFAVVAHGDTALSAGNTAGPVAQSLDPVQCHPVATGSSAGHAYTIYALWIDGRDDSESGRPDFPVMGNAGFAGTAHLFAVFEPIGGAPAGPLPAVLSLHGGTGNFWLLRPTLFPFLGLDLDVPDGLYVTLDDGVHVAKDAGLFGPQVVEENTRWLGYWEDYDRFTPPAAPPPADGVVVDYTLRRIDFTIDWMTANLDVDAERVSLWGISMGGSGTGFYARSRPNRLSAGHVMVSGFDGGGNPFNLFMQGDEALNLPTNLGELGVTDLYHPTNTLSPDDLCFLRFTFGTNDVTTGWAEKPPVFDELNQLRWGSHVYWDERMHGPSGGGWLGAHWLGSPRQDPGDLTRYRRDRSYPAVSDDDYDLALPGRQPDPGDAVEPANGDPWGTWGGYVDWDPDSVAEDAGTWSVTLQLVATSPFPNDVPAADLALASVSVRRPQAFLPAPHEPLVWSLTRLSDGQLLQSGVAQTRADGLAGVDGLELVKEPLELELQRASAAAPVVAYGAPTPSCAGAPAIAASGVPQVGAADFALQSTGAPPGGSGTLGLSAAPQSLPFLGITLLVDPTSPTLSLFPVTADGAAAASVSLPLPNNPAAAGLVRYAQFAWVDACGPQGLAATEALALTVQP